MKIAYIILAHKLPAQLVRLVKRLDAPGTHFFIHIDKNSDNEVYKQIVSDLSLMKNVFFLKRFESPNGGKLDAFRRCWRVLERLSILELILITR